MDQWIAKAQELLNLVLRNRTSMGETIGLGLAGFIAMVILFKWAGRAAGMRDVPAWRRLAALVVGLALLMASAVAVSLYIAPRFDNQAGSMFLVAAPVFTAVIIAVPLQMLTLRCKFFEALIGFVAALIAGFLVITAGGMIIDAVHAGKKQTSVIQKDQETIDAIINKK